MVQRFYRSILEGDAVPETGTFSRSSIPSRLSASIAFSSQGLSSLRESGGERK